MTDDLREIRERLDFAEGEISTTRGEISAYIDRAIEVKAFLAYPGKDIRLRVVEALPSSIRSRVGAAIHEVRSCLDALACRLAERNGQNAKGVYFPISKSAAVFADDGIRKLKKLSSSDVVKITALKPHAEANPLLFGMHDFDRVRKHQRLGLATANSNSIRVPGHQPEGRIERMMVSTIGRLTPEWQTAANILSNTEFTLQFPISVVFEEPAELAGREVIQSAYEFAKTAAEIVNLFD